MIREKLYCTGKKGEIRIFYGKITNSLSSKTDSLISVNSDFPIIKTYTGVLGGKLKETSTTVLTGKQKRTIIEQAEFQLKSDYNSKYDEGYKSLEDLMTKLSELKKNNLVITGNPEQHIPAIFAAIPIYYNTTKNWKPLPMLAEKWNKGKKATFPAFVQPKLNGVRCLIQWNKDTKEVEMCSRGGKMYNLPHIKEHFESFYKEGNINIIFDGELYKHGVPLQKISGDVRREDPTKAKYLEYHVYDLAYYNTDQETRFVHLRRYLSRILKVRSNKEKLKDAFTSLLPIKAVITYPVSAKEQVKLLHDNFVEAGYEGAIYRSYEGLYEFSFRSTSLLKVKEFIDEEFEILGCEVDPNKTIGDSFVFILNNNQGKIIAKDNNTFKARPTGTIADKETWYKEIDKFIGKKATVRFQERTVDGLPHQAHVRHKNTPILIEAIRDYE